MTPQAVTPFTTGPSQGNLDDRTQSPVKVAHFCSGALATNHSGVDTWATSVFKSVTDLEVTIYQYLAEHNDHPKPFTWTATTKEILEKVERARASLKAAVGTK